MKRSLFEIFVFGSFLSSAAFGADIVFDNFEDMDLLNDAGTWELADGTNPDPDVSSGDLVLSTADCCSGVFHSEPISGDVSVRIQARVHSGSLGLVANGSESNGSYFVQVRPDGRFDGLVPGLPDGIPFGGVSVPVAAGTDKDVIFQLDVVGKTVSSWFWEVGKQPPASPQISIELTDKQAITEPGVAGIFVGFGAGGAPSSSTVRYIQVADAPIPIPEPSCAVLLLGGIAFWGFGERREKLSRD